jgi:hypothetical protein
MRTVRIILITLAALMGLLRIGLMLPSRVTHQDFAHYYLSSRLLWQGASPYRSELGLLHASHGFSEADVVNHTANPPTLVWLFAPLTALRPWPAFLTWTGIQALSLLALLWGVRRLLGDRLPPEMWLLLAALTWISEPVYAHFQCGQVQLLLAGLILAAYGLQRAGRQHSAVAIITLTGLLKLFPLALMPWFLWRASSSPWGRAWYALEAVLIAAGVVALTGPQQWRDFAAYGMPMVKAYLVNHPFNYSVTSAVGTVASAAGWTATPEALALWLRLGTLAGFAMIGLAYAVVARSRAEPELQFALLSTAMVVGSPTAWGHYLVLLLAPLALGGAVLWPRASVMGRGSLIGLGLLLMNAGAELLWSGRSVWLNVFLHYVPLYALLGLIAYLITAGQRAPRVSVTERSLA